jgi:hypothetical protein
MSACLIPVLSAVLTPADAPPRPETDGERTGLQHALSTIPDPHCPRGARYPLVRLLTVAVCAVDLRDALDRIHTNSVRTN